MPSKISSTPVIENGSTLMETLQTPVDTVNARITAIQRRQHLLQSLNSIWRVKSKAYNSSAGDYIDQSLSLKIKKDGTPDIQVSATDSRPNFTEIRIKNGSGYLSNFKLDGWTYVSSNVPASIKGPACIIAFANSEGEIYGVLALAAKIPSSNSYTLLDTIITVEKDTVSEEVGVSYDSTSEITLPDGGITYTRWTISLPSGVLTLAEIHAALEGSIIGISLGVNIYYWGKDIATSPGSIDFSGALIEPDFESRTYSFMRNSVELTIPAYLLADSTSSFWRCVKEIFTPRETATSYPLTMAIILPSEEYTEEISRYEINDSGSLVLSEENICLINEAFQILSDGTYAGDARKGHCLDPLNTVPFLTRVSATEIQACDGTQFLAGDFSEATLLSTDGTRSFLLTGARGTLSQSPSIYYENDSGGSGNITAWSDDNVGTYSATTLISESSLAAPSYKLKKVWEIDRHGVNYYKGNNVNYSTEPASPIIQKPLFSIDRYKNMLLLGGETYEGYLRNSRDIRSTSVRDLNGNYTYGLGNQAIPTQNITALIAPGTIAASTKVNGSKTGFTFSRDFIPDNSAVGPSDTGCTSSIHQSFYNIEKGYEASDTYTKYDGFHFRTYSKQLTLGATTSSYRPITGGAPAYEDSSIWRAYTHFRGGDSKNTSDYSAEYEVSIKSGSSYLEAIEQGLVTGLAKISSDKIARDAVGTVVPIGTPLSTTAWETETFTGVNYCTPGSTVVSAEAGIRACAAYGAQPYIKTGVSFSSSALQEDAFNKSPDQMFSNSLGTIVGRLFPNAAPSIDPHKIAGLYNKLGTPTHMACILTGMSADQDPWVYIGCPPNTAVFDPYSSTGLRIDANSAFLKTIHPTISGVEDYITSFGNGLGLTSMNGTNMSMLALSGSKFKGLNGDSGTRKYCGIISEPTVSTLGAYLKEGSSYTEYCGFKVRPSTSLATPRCEIFTSHEGELESWIKLYPKQTAGLFPQSAVNLHIANKSFTSLSIMGEDMIKTNVSCNPNGIPGVNTLRSGISSNWEQYSFCSLRATYELGAENPYLVSCTGIRVPNGKDALIIYGGEAPLSEEGQGILLITGNVLNDSTTTRYTLKPVVVGGETFYAFKEIVS